MWVKHLKSQCVTWPVSSRAYFNFSRIDMEGITPHLAFYIDNFLLKCSVENTSSRIWKCVSRQNWVLGFFKVSSGKTSKIISILFSITFFTCAFWSQHASPLRLSPFNRWLKHMEGKSVLARSNVTMRKFLNFWDEDFQRIIFRRPHAVTIYFAPVCYSFIQ